MHTILLACLLLAQKEQKQDLKKVWKAGKPFETMFKKLPPTVKFEDESVTLKNRGLLLSKKEHKKGLRLSFTWEWVEGEGNYPDILVVALKTDGKQREWPGEIDHGIVVRFSPGRTAIERWKSGEDSEVIAFKAVTIKKETQYKIVIEEKNGDVTVTIDDERLTARVEGGKKSRGAIFNREPVAQVLHVSRIMNLRLVPKK